MSDDSQAPAQESPDLGSALGQLAGSGKSALDQFGQDQAKLDSVTQDMQNVPEFDPSKENQQAPQINPNGIMATMPYALALATLGGKVAGLHPSIMLGAMNGMTEGIIKGQRDRYEDEKAKYDDAYQKYMDKYKQQAGIYKQMQAVYRGDVNADLKALEVALRATGFQGKIDQDTLHAWQWKQTHSLKLEEVEMKKQAAADKAKKDEETNGLLDEQTLALAVKDVEAHPENMRNYVSSMGKNGSAVRKQIQSAIAGELKSRNSTPEQLVSQRAVAKGEVASVAKLIPQKRAVEAFEGVAKFNGSRLVALAKKLGGGPIPLTAGAARFAQKHGGSNDAAEFTSVLQTFQTEAARILNNPNLTGQLTDSARNDLKKVVDGSLTTDQLDRVIGRLEAEMDVRKLELDRQIQEASKNVNPSNQSSYIKTKVASDGVTYGQTADGNWVAIKDSK